MKLRILVGIIVGLIMVGFNLATESGLIPFDEYRYESPVLTFVYALVNLPVVIAVPLTGATSNVSIMAMFFVWWFIVGYFCAWAVERYLNRTKTKREVDVS